MPRKSETRKDDDMSADLSEKLDIIIRLQASALVSSLDSSKEKILFLHKAGLRPKLIADILGTSSNHVNVTLSQTRKPSRPKRGRKSNDK